MWGRKRSDGDQKPPTAPSTPAAAASAVSRVNSDAIRSAVPDDKKPHGLAPGPDKGGEHCFSQLDATTFQVRGPRYLHDKAKVPAGPSIFDLMHVDVFLSNDKIGNVAARKDSWLRAAREAGDPRYYLVILYVTPAAPFIHLIMYYAVNEERLEGLPHAAKLWKSFTAHGPEADDFRNDRWKVIPRVAEGSWVVQKAVGAKPALLAQKLTHTWVINDGLSDDAGASSSASAPAPAPAGAATTSVGCDANLPHSGARVRGGSVVSTTGPGPYLEADCDVASSNMAFVLVSLLQQYAKYIVIDLGFAIEPRADDECPEVVLGSVRLSRIDVTKPPLVSADAGDMILGSVGVTHGDDDEEGGDGDSGGEGSGDEGGAGSDGDGK